MRIKGSELRRIIKEEISRSRRLSEAGNETELSFDPTSVVGGIEIVDMPISEIDKRDIARKFTSTFINFLHHSPDNAIRNLIKKESRIAFKGVIEGGNYWKNTELGRTALFQNNEGYGLVFNFTQMGIDGKRVPQDVVEAFNKQVRKLPGKGESLDFMLQKPVNFFAYFTLAGQDLDLLFVSKMSDTSDDSGTKQFVDYITSRIELS